MAEEQREGTTEGRAAAATPRIRWEDTQLKSSYASVCNTERSSLCRLSITTRFHASTFPD